MLKSKKITRRSALKSLLVVSALPTVFLSSCAKNLTSPEISKDESSKLYKTNLDSEIGSLDNIMVFKNSNGNVELSQNYIHSGKSGKGGKYVLTRTGEEEFTLFFTKVEVVGKNGKNYLVSGDDLSDGTIIIAKPSKALHALKKINFQELKRKFVAGIKMNGGGN